MHFAKQSKNKKTIAILLVIAMLLTIMPVTVFAEGDTGENGVTEFTNGSAEGSTPSAIQFYAENAEESITALNLFVGDTANITTAVVDENGTVISDAIAEVTVTSDDETTVSYENSMITAKAAGEAVLTANYADITANLPVIVTAVTVDPKEYAAAIGNTGYKTLQEAINAVGEGGTIQLLGSVIENIVSKDKSYTLEMNGNTITADSKGVTTELVTSFTIINGDVVINNGSICGGVGVCLSVANSTVNLNNCTVSGCVKSSKIGNYGGIYVQNTQLIMSNCTVSDNVAGANTQNGGGGITLKDNSSLVGSDLTINGNTGYGIFSNGCSVQLKDSTISSNVGSSSNGVYGTIYVKKVNNVMPEVVINNTKINNNGAGITLENISGSISNVTIAENGGGIKLKDFAEGFTLEQVSIENCEDTVILSVESANSFHAINCTFNANKTRSSDSAVIALKGAGDKILENCTLSNNIYTGTQNNGSTILIDKSNTGTVKIVGCKIIDNSCLGTGTVLNAGSGNIDISNTLIQENSGKMAGGIYHKNSTMTVTNTVIKDNIAQSSNSGSAGGVRVDSGSFEMSSGALYHNESGFSGAPDLWVATNVKALNVLAAKEMHDAAIDSDYFSKEKFVWKNGNNLIDEDLSKQAGGQGYQAVSNVKHNVAQIGETEYTSLQEAVTAAKRGDTIVLTGDSLGKKIPSATVDITKSITIDMNGCTITAEKDGIFHIKSGTLTLCGEGVLEDRIDVNTSGTLNLNGNIKIQSKQASINPDTKCAVTNRGIVNVNTSIDTLDIYCAPSSPQGKTAKFTLSEEGSVGVLNLTQGKSKADLNGHIGTLNLKHYANAKTIAGANFTVEELSLFPYLTEQQKKELNDPVTAVSDIMVIQGHGSDDAITEKTSWNVPNYDWKYQFLTKAVLDDNGNIVLRKKLLENNYVFLDNKAGNDESTGLSMEEPVKNFEQALRVLEAANEDREEPITDIWLLTPYTVSNGENWSAASDLGYDVVVKRAPLYENTKETGMIFVSKGAALTLGNIILDGNNGEKEKAKDSLVYVANGGSLDIKEGAVLRNNMRLANQRTSERLGGAVYIAEGGMAVMTDGTIENNTAYIGGGVYTEGEFILNGGNIQGNIAQGKTLQAGASGNSENDYFHSAGGGVMVAKNGTMNMIGGIVQSNKAYHGAGISLGSDSSGFVEKADDDLEFTMTGGTITGNNSENSGGGLFVQENFEAEIMAGAITNNISDGGLFGGGGIYVNGGKQLNGNYQNGRLTLKNVVITDNAASSGGGIAGCPSAEVEIYLQDGGVITDNTNHNNSKDDLYFTTIGGMIRKQPVFISEYMMGGGLYNWKDVTDNTLVANNVLHRVANLHAYADPTTITADTEDFKVVITGNKAKVNGGGIGTNGDVIIGNGPEKVEITVDKKWINTNGDELDGDETKDVESITFELYRHLASQSENDDEYVGFITIKAQEDTSTGWGWPQAKFKNQPETNADGEKWVYTVKEQDSDNFNGKIKKVDNNEYAWLATNTLSYNLKLEKQVSGKPDTDKFEFEITLKNGDGTLVNTTIDTVDHKNNEGSLTFKDGKATIVLGAGEFIQLNNLNKGMKYSIEEKTKAEKTEITIKKGEQAAAPIGFINDQEIVMGINEIVFTNSYGPIGDLKIGKTVAGNAGDKTKSWTFNVKMDSENLANQYAYTGSAIDGIPVPADGILELKDGVGTITLKHGQFVTITRLPANTECAVTELEANKDGYKTTVKTLVSTDAGELKQETVWTDNNSFSGKIGENEILEGAFVNTKNSTTPTDPTDPTKPEEPSDPDEPTIDIPDPDVPLTEPEEPTIDIEDPDVPLTDVPGETVEIEEPEVPLGDAPATGDRSAAIPFAVLMLIAAAGLAITRKRFN